MYKNVFNKLFDSIILTCKNSIQTHTCYELICLCTITITSSTWPTSTHWPENMCNIVIIWLKKTVLENFEGDIYSLGEHDHNPLCFSVSKWQVWHYTYVKICIFYKQWAIIKLWHYGMTQDLTWSEITWYAWWKYCNEPYMECCSSVWFDFCQGPVLAFEYFHCLLLCVHSCCVSITSLSRQ